MFSEQPTEKIQKIADAVLALSDYYIQNPSGETPWSEKFCQLAYRHYFLPLNFARCTQVIERGLEVGFFDDISHFIDWGSGPGTASLALAQNSSLKIQIKEQILYDISDSVSKNFSDLHTSLINPSFFNRLDLSRLKSKDRSCAVFSYSLTEVPHLPEGWEQLEAIMILEPSTSQDGRKLLETRQQLIAKGFSLWAPCTHQLNCPLMTHSKNDWCHDRAHVKAPGWFLELEAKLPMKNKTVTTSYLLARKRKPSAQLANKARLTGDSLDEKGKTRQLVCRGEQREFLTWMHKKISPQVFPRGELIELPADLEVKSNELRLQSPLKA